MPPTPQSAEIEKRFRVTDGDVFDQTLASLSLFRITRTTDEFFDTPDKTYYEKSVLIRLRNNVQLGINTTPRHDDNENTALHFSVPFDQKEKEAFGILTELFDLKRPLPFSFPHFLGCNHLRHLVTLDHHIKVYTHGSLFITVDTLPHLGTFVTFGSQKSTESFEKTTREILSLAPTLPLEPIASSCLDLALQKLIEPLV